MLNKFFKKLVGLGTTEASAPTPAPAASPMPPRPETPGAPVPTAAPRPEKPDIHVDLDGTFLIYVKDEKNNVVQALNPGLAEVLTERQEAGHRIVFHSGGHLESKAAQVKTLATQQAPALANAPVLSKADRQGEKLELVIDDDSASHLKGQYGFVINQHIDVTGGAPKARTDAPYFREKIDAAMAVLRPAPAPASASVSRPAPG